MGRIENPNLKNDYERACGWYGHFNKSEMALFSECTDRYAQKLLDTADIVREAIYQQLSGCETLTPSHRNVISTGAQRMRRIRYGVAASLDGFIAGPNGEVDWITLEPEVDFAEIWAQFDTL